MAVPPPAWRLGQDGHGINLSLVVIPPVGGHGRASREPVERLLGRVLLRELLVRARLPHKLHAVELHRRPEQAALDLLRLVGRVAVPGARQQSLELVLGVVPAAVARRG